MSKKTRFKMLRGDCNEDCEFPEEIILEFDKMLLGIIHRAQLILDSYNDFSSIRINCYNHDTMASKQFDEINNVVNIGTEMITVLSDSWYYEIQSGYDSNYRAEYLLEDDMVSVFPYLSNITES